MSVDEVRVRLQQAVTDGHLTIQDVRNVIDTLTNEGIAPWDPAYEQQLMNRCVALLEDTWTLL